MSRGAAARCPYCKSPGRIRSSEEVSLLHRDVYFDCTSDRCGHRWKAQLSFVHSIATPVEQGSDVNLPVTPERYRRARRDGEPPPAPVPA